MESGRRRPPELSQFSWMLDTVVVGSGNRTDLESAVSEYGSLTELNQSGLILSSLGSELLNEIARDYLDLLETSTAIYELNGDYALGLFSSGWCRFLDAASRRLCNTEDNAKALASGKWLCHESCWKSASQQSILTKKPVDIACKGGLHLYAIPIFAAGMVVGCLNIGYGDPPSDPARLASVARLYQVEIGDLTKEAVQYHSRPPFLIRMAKQRMHSSARLIGALVEKVLVERELIEERDHARTYLEVAGVMLIAFDLDAKVTMINTKGCEMLGLPQSQIIGKDWIDSFVPVETRPAIRERFLALTAGLAPPVSSVHENQMLSGDGTRCLMLWRSTVLRDADGTITGLLSSGQDITKERKIAEALAVEKEQLEVTLMSVGDAVVSTNAEGEIVLMNPVAEQLTNLPFAKVSGKAVVHMLPLVDGVSGKRLDLVATGLSKAVRLELPDSCLLEAGDGTRREIEGTVSPVKGHDGSVQGLVMVFRDCSERRRRQAEIAHLSYRDQLTGLHNRRSYEVEIQKLDKDPWYPLCLLMADVNGLKLTNDAFGHAAGDELLRRIASVLRRECRSDDVVARIGGDEFVILLPRTDAIQARLVSARLSDALKKNQGDKMIMSVSFGHAVKLDAKVPISEVFRQAEDDMYRQKLLESPGIRSKTIDMLLQSLYEKSPREQQHSLQVGYLCEKIAKSLHLTESETESLQRAGVMHDIGKIALDEDLLNKPAALDESEWAEVKRHAEIGYNILGSVHKYSPFAEYVLYHHERWDGGGYPRGLSGADIPLESRIITLADSYDSMVVDRPFKSGKTQEEAVEELHRCAGTQFDPELTHLFVEQVLHATW